MIHSINAPAKGRNGRPLVITWDEEAGTVAGPGAGLVLELADAKVIPYGRPPGRNAELSAEPLRSRRDMALIIGVSWRVPEFLLSAYPQDDVPPSTPGTYPGEDGIGTIVGTD